MRIETARGARRGALAAPSRGGLFTQSKRFLGRDWPVAYFFVGPLVLLLFGLIGYPLVYALWMSTHNVINITDRGFVGLEMYQRLWTDDQFIRSVRITVQFAVISVFFKFWVGLGAALLLNRKARFRAVFTGLILLPWIIPEVVAALTWRGLYDPVFGGLNLLLESLGIISKGIAWTGDYKLALPAVIVVNIWKGIPFFTIILLAGLKSIPNDLYDAAAVDGADGWQRFWNVTLPGLRYVMIVACLLSLIWTLNGFGLVYLITSGGPAGATRLFSILAYEHAIGERRYSLGVAVAMAVVPFLLVLIVVLGRYMRGDPSTATATGTGRFARLNLELVGRVVGGLIVLGLLVFMFGPQGALIVVVAGAALVFLIGLAARGVSAGGARLRDAVTKRESRREEVYRRNMTRVGGFGAWALLIALACVELFPFYWVFITAFKSDDQIRSLRSIFWPEPWSVSHFTYMLQKTDFPRWFVNSVEVSIVTVFISLLVGSLGAYGLVRLRWRGAAFLSTAILFAYLMPGVMLFIPLYKIFTVLHLVDTLYALMIAYPTFGLPFACWLLMGYYRSIPSDLEEAALIDGCNYLQAFFRIILPLTLPALLTVALFAITSAFNEFLFAYVFVRPEPLRTLPVGLANMVIGDIFPWGNLFAACILTTIPVVIVYMLAQRFMVEGLTAGSVKG
ncbi:MAG TPA: ABC transporter permease subunit [Thermomicrobiales bacterium]|nr:ABC transporter permease subunit [Thermomicrobiales bacterium]